MSDRILDTVADKLLRDALGDTSALTPAQRAERDGLNDPESFCEFTGPMRRCTPEHVGTLALYGLTPSSVVRAEYRDEYGRIVPFNAPASDCFRCLGVCPAYWSLDSLAHYARKMGFRSTYVWYVMSKGEHVPGSPELN